MPTKITVGWDKRFEWTVGRQGERLDNSLKKEIGSWLLGVLMLASRQSADGFVIIEREPQHFMQCLNEDQGWVLEKREGGAGAHFRAGAEQPDVPREGLPPIVAKILEPPSYPSLLLTFEQVSEAMIAYLTDCPEPDWIDWQKVDV